MLISPTLVQLDWSLDFIMCALSSKWSHRAQRTAGHSWSWKTTEKRVRGPSCARLERNLPAKVWEESDRQVQPEMSACPNVQKLFFFCCSRLSPASCWSRCSDREERGMSGIIHDMTWSVEKEPGQGGGGGGGPSAQHATSWGGGGGE